MKYKATQKDRYGNMKSLEITMDNQLEVPPMTSAIPMYDHPGEPRGTDTVPAWLTPGEFVVNKEAVDMYGPLIKKINNEGRKVQNMKPQYAKSGKEIEAMIESIMQAEENKSGGSQFTNYKGDKPTQYGITLDTYRELINSKATIEDLKTLTREKAKDIFKKDYYERYKIDKLPDYMQHNVLDMAINAGPGNAIKLLQKQIGVDIDNVIGPNTIKAAKNYNLPKQFNNIYGSNRVSYYEDLVKGNKQKEQFLSGWKNRVMDLMDPENVTLPTPKPTITLPQDPSEVLGGGLMVSDIPRPDSDSQSLGGAAIGAVQKGMANTYDNIRKSITGMMPNFNDAEEIKARFNKRKKEALNKPLDSLSEYDFKNKGGPIYASQGVGLGTYEEEMLKNLQNDYGSILNPFDTTYSSGFDYGDATMPESYKPPVLVPTPDVYADPNKLTTTVQNEVPVPNEFIMNPNELDNLGQQNDSTSMSSIPGDMPNPFEGYAFSDTKPFDNVYDQMVQDELSGSPAYEIPAPLNIDPDAYDQETGDKLLEVERPVSMEVTKPNMLQMEGDILSNLMLPTDVGIAAQIAEKQQMLDNEMKNLIIYRDVKPNPKMLETSRKIVNKLQDQIKNLKRTQALVEFRETSDVIPKVEAAKEEMQKEANKVALEQVISSDKTTETEKTVASQALDDLNKQEDTTEVTTPLEESQSKLAAVANNLNTAKEAELNQDLNSDAGKAAQNDANQSQGTPAYEQAKGVLNFLFGDLIDGQELGRGIAIYLASRALGYDHNDTIGYVAKNYLKRVDTKNALMDKFIRENAGKYTKKSLADYKRTGDPNMLSPIGSTPRPQGEEKTYYNAAGQARVAYKFKKKNAQGDDFTYWSWDKDGGDVKQRVSSAWTSDGSDVPNAPEYEEKINKAADRIVGQMKAFKEGKDKTKERNIDKGIMQNVYTTDIEPEFAAREVAAWADKNGFQVYKMGPGIQQAWTMAIEAAKEAEAQGIDVSITSLLPYLEEATIKQRLDNLKGVPPVSTAIVNGNKIEMNPSELVILNGKINNVTGDVNRFWNTVAKVYKGNDKESGKPWKKIFEQHVIDSGENITPFALFGQVYLENIMEGMANQ